MVKRCEVRVYDSMMGELLATYTYPTEREALDDWPTRSAHADAEGQIAMLVIDEEVHHT